MRMGSSCLPNGMFAPVLPDGTVLICLLEGATGLADGLGCDALGVVPEVKFGKPVRKLLIFFLCFSLQKKKLQIQ